MSEIILCMYKGVIAHQRSPLNICFITLLMKNGLSRCSPHYSSPGSPIYTFHNFQKLKNITSSFQSPPQISTVTAVIVRCLKGVYKFMG